MERAQTLYAQGADAERHHDLNRAVHLYRLAMHLVPDIDLRSQGFLFLKHINT